MKSSSKTKMLHLLFIGFAAGIFTTACFDRTKTLPAHGQGTTRIDNLFVSEKLTYGDLANALNSVFTKIAETTIPVTVSIATEHVVQVQPSPFFGFPFEDFFGFPFGGPPGQRERGQPQPREYRRQGLGSGIIIDSKGYILTNNHVIADAAEIVVNIKINGENKEFPAEVVGADPGSDVALIKIDPKKYSLPSASIGDSDKLKIGEWVAAVGAPLGLPETFTTGVVSALHRQVALNLYENFIQTDAPINPGNSGGPLVNLRGEVIGINTAIATRTGGYQGIGFAIPINMAMKIMEDLLEKGEVSRGWLGISMQEITDDNYQAFNLKSKMGVLVTDVLAGSPAEKGGLKRGDVIVEVNDTRVDNPNRLRNLIGGMSPNDKATVRIIRQGNEKTITVTLARREVEPQASAQTPNEDAEIKTAENILGVEVANITTDIINRYNLDPNSTGIIVLRIKRDSPAARAGIRPADNILQVNHKNIRSVKDFENALKAVPQNASFPVLIRREGATNFVVVNLAQE